VAVQAEERTHVHAEHGSGAANLRAFTHFVGR
jgi:hypothetical protein